MPVLARDNHVEIVHTCRAEQRLVEGGFTLARERAPTPTELRLEARVAELEQALDDLMDAYVETVDERDTARDRVAKLEGELEDAAIEKLLDEQRIRLLAGVLAREVLSGVEAASVTRKRIIELERENEQLSTALGGWEDAHSYVARTSRDRRFRRGGAT